MSIPASAIAWTASGCRPRASVPALCASKRSPASALRKPSAICERAELCVHRKSTRRRSGTRMSRSAELAHDAGDLVHGPLADVLDPVAHPLQVMRRPEQPRRAVDGVGVVRHVLEELAVDDAVEAIDLVVLQGDALGGQVLSLDERV